MRTLSRSLLAIIALAPLVARASPRSEVDKALTGGWTGLTDWRYQAGKTWEKTTDNTVVQILHTPINAWGVPVANRARGNRATCTVLGTACGGGTCMDLDYLRTDSTMVAPRQCASHSDQMMNDVWTLISQAQHQVDITSLFGSEGELDVAIKNGIQFAANELARTGATHKLTVRALFGEQHAGPTFEWAANLFGLDAPELLERSTEAKALIERWAAGLSNGAAGKLNLYGGVYHPSISIWNHAKIIAVDGKRALVGGHNMWSGVYTKPRAAVHDMSILVEGSAAMSAHKYANTMWDVVCSAPDSSDQPGVQSVWRWDQTSNSALTAVDTEFDWRAPSTCEDGIQGLLPPVTAGTGTMTVYAAGKTGLWKTDQLLGGATGSGQNPSDDALAAMIRGAGTSVLISQQDVRGVEEDHAKKAKQALRWLPGWLIDSLTVQGYWTKAILKEIAEAAARNVQVKIIISDPDNVDGGYQSLGATALIDAIMPYWPTSAPAARLCNIAIAHFRDTDDHPARNHPKMIITDEGTGDAGYYVGSQNLYGNDLAEFGYIVFGQAATANMMTGYWNSAWRYSGGVNGERVYRACGPIDQQYAAAVYGQPGFVTANPGTAKDRMSAPNGVAFIYQRLEVADSNNARILSHDFSKAPMTVRVLGQPNPTTGTAPTTITDSNFGKVTDGNRLAMTSDAIVVSDSSRNRVLAISFGPLTIRVLGQTATNTGGAGTTNAQLRNPTGVWTDGKRIAVADTGNNRVLVWNTWPTTDGAPADLVLGQADFTTQPAQPVSASTMTAPRGVAITDAGLYVADTGNNRVLVWSGVPTTNGAAAAHVLGQTGLAASTAGTSATTLRGPVDVEVVRKGLFVVDSGNNRVLMYNGDVTTDGPAAMRVIGQADMTSAGAATTQRGFNAPQDLTIEDGRMFVADRDNHRILEFRVYVPN